MWCLSTLYVYKTKKHLISFPKNASSTSLIFLRLWAILFLTTRPTCFSAQKSGALWEVPLFLSLPFFHRRILNVCRQSHKISRTRLLRSFISNKPKWNTRTILVQTLSTMRVSSAVKSPQTAIITSACHVRTRLTSRSPTRISWNLTTPVWTPAVHRTLLALLSTSLLINPARKSLKTLLIWMLRRSAWILFDRRSPQGPETPSCKRSSSDLNYCSIARPCKGLWGKPIGIEARIAFYSRTCEINFRTFCRKGVIPPVR